MHRALGKKSPVCRKSSLHESEKSWGLGQRPRSTPSLYKNLVHVLVLKVSSGAIYSPMQSRAAGAYSSRVS
jgi:hypothetical protein